MCGNIKNAMLVANGCKELVCVQQFLAGGANKRRQASVCSIAQVVYSISFDKRAKGFGILKKIAALKQ